MQISVFGTGYVGLVTAIGLANSGHDVLCYDINKDKINTLKKNIMPFYEPGMKELVKKTTKDEKLRFTTDEKEAIQHANVIFNCVGTPPKKDGSADLTAVYAVAQAIAKHATTTKYLIHKSTVPPGTAKYVTETYLNGKQIHIISNPEFLKEGSAIYDYFHPDRIVIGYKDKNAPTIMREVYKAILKPDVPLVETTWESAETIKYANNSFLATKISFINEIANICDITGADVNTVAKALGLDYRINPRFLNAGIGYGGSCFPKDVQALIHLAKQNKYDPKLLEEVHELNKRQQHKLIEKLNKHINPTGKTIAILGLSFKPKTSDIREAPALTIIQELQKQKANIQAYDPEAMHEMQKIYPDVKMTKDPYEAAKNADAILILTEWSQFRVINLKQLKQQMKGNILCDGRNIINPVEAKQAGFEYEGIGQR